MTLGKNKWDDYERLKRLAHPDRERLFPRAPVLALLNLSQGAAVADVGAGSGYMIRELAVAVGEAGRVFAIDPSPAARQHIMEQFPDHAYPQVTVQAGTAEQTGLGEFALDRMLWHALYHELTDTAQAYREAFRVLKPSGRLVVVDWLPRDTGMGPPVEERVDRQVAAEAAERAGFRVLFGDSLQEGPVTWNLVLERP